MKRKLYVIMRSINKNKYIYLLLLPGFIYYFIFAYLPMYGVTIAFKDFKFNKGILGSPWIGFAKFGEIFRLQDFWIAFRNTIIISLQRLLIEFPAPIILALLLNEVINTKLKRFYQTVYTFPHFLSWIVVAGIIMNLLGDEGVINKILIAMGKPKQDLLVNPEYFRYLLYITNIWKSAGWSAIIYLAAIVSINPELYEAAKIDGATRLQQIVYITLPGIKSTIAILFILAIGNLMNAGFDQIFNLYNPAVYEVADIIDTYIYRRTFQLGSDFSTSAAVGLFKGVINVVLLLGANKVVRKLGEEGLF